jgi:hypothetical protein
VMVMVMVVTSGCRQRNECLRERERWVTVEEGKVDDARHLFMKCPATSSWHLHTKKVAVSSPEHQTPEYRKEPSVKLSTAKVR